MLDNERLITKLLAATQSHTLGQYLKFCRHAPQIAPICDLAILPLRWRRGPAGRTRGWTAVPPQLLSERVRRPGAELGRDAGPARLDLHRQQRWRTRLRRRPLAHNSRRESFPGPLA